MTPEEKAKIRAEIIMSLKEGYKPKVTMTAVEWFGKELESYGDPEFCEIEWEQLDSLIQQAKEMEKQQIIDAWNDVGADGVTTAEEYYINKFKSE